MIKLSNRLRTIQSLVPINATILDVGCDHGLLDISIYQNNISKKIIASDINKEALNNAIANIKKNQLEYYIETRLGNGLEVITKEDNIDTVIISGMGAHTIIGILKNNKEKLKSIDTIIIGSNTKNYLVRKCLQSLGFHIDSEVVVTDNKKYYIIIKFIKGKKKYTKKELTFGPVLLKENSKTFQEYSKIELEKLYIIKRLLHKNRVVERYKIQKQINSYKKTLNNKKNND